MADGVAVPNLSTENNMRKWWLFERENSAKGRDDIGCRGHYLGFTELVSYIGCHRKRFG